MPEKVATKLSFFETDMEYAAPYLKLYLDRARIVASVYEALRPWNINIDDVDIITTGKPSEQGVKLKIPPKQSSFFMGPVSCKFSRDSTDWSVAHETIQMIDAAVSALQNETDIKIVKRKTVIAFHLQPEKLPFMKILSPFVPKTFSDLEEGFPEGMASIVTWPYRKVTLDTSAHVPTEFSSGLRGSSTGALPTIQSRSSCKATKSSYLRFWILRAPNNGRHRRESNFRQRLVAIRPARCTHAI